MISILQETKDFLISKHNLINELNVKYQEEKILNYKINIFDEISELIGQIDNEMTKVRKGRFLKEQITYICPSCNTEYNIKTEDADYYLKVVNEEVICKNCANKKISLNFKGDEKE